MFFVLRVCGIKGEYEESVGDSVEEETNERVLIVTRVREVRFGEPHRSSGTVDLCGSERGRTEVDEAIQFDAASLSITPGQGGQKVSLSVCGQNGTDVVQHGVYLVEGAECLGVICLASCNARKTDVGHCLIEKTEPMYFVAIF